MLHETVVFVGDRPNMRQDLHPEVPFVGTASYKTILEWIYRMSLDINDVVTMHAHDVHGAPIWHLEDLLVNPGIRKVVALGVAATERLKTLQAEHPYSNFKFFSLPHPGDVKDKAKVTRALAECKKFIYSR